ncbi:MarR family transcriptional regulator [Streptococcus ruminantium]|uniref:MarR family transcriptional regulator n=1 Tax=Streptococcus ruminantium TaxID=1917441 RepID=A0A2Z5TMW2_9STRE|nr:MarR family transcriptional regulator [Streptococcus ruminantium]
MRDFLDERCNLWSIQPFAEAMSEEYQPISSHLKALMLWSA